MKKVRSSFNSLWPGREGREARARLFALGGSSSLGQIRASVFVSLALFWLWALISPVLGHALTPALQYQHVIYNDSGLRAGTGLTLELSPERFSPFYVGLSLDHSTLLLGGQEAADLALAGAGIGVKIPQRFFELNLGTAFYYPFLTTGCNTIEALWIHINNLYPDGKVPYSPNDLYDYELHGNLGAYAKLDFKYKLSKGLWFDFSVGYRFLQLREMFHRTRGSWYVNFQSYRDFSGGIVFIGITRRF